MDEVVIRLHLEPLDDAGFVATSPDVPGLVVEARTISEAVSLARDVARKMLESCLEHGDPIPAALQRLGGAPVPATAVDLLIPVEAA